MIPLVDYRRIAPELISLMKTGTARRDMTMGLMEKIPSQSIQSSAERRRSLRIPLLVRVECRTPQTYVFGHCENLSETGMLVLAKEILAEGSDATLRFALQPKPCFKTADPRETGSNSHDRYGWFQVLSAGCEASLWACHALRSSDQEAQKRPCCQGGAESKNGGHVALGRILANVRGLKETEHLVYKKVVMATQQLQMIFQPLGSPGMTQRPTMQVRRALPNRQIQSLDDGTVR